MTAVACARIVAASLFVSAGSVLADEPAAASTPAARAASPTGAAASNAAEPAASERSKKPPPAVIVVPLLGVVFLPLTLPVTEPRVRRTAPAATSTSGAQP